MRSLEKVVEDIKSVKVQGAKEIAIYSLKFLKEFCKENGFGLKFEVAAKVLEDARPTAVVLHNCLEILKKEKRIRTFDKLIKQLDKATKRIAKNGSRLIKSGYKIMTHCHSGEALAVIKKARNEGKRISIFATITEPLEQGVRTAKELAKLKIPVTLITDNAAGFFVKDVDCVLVGADAIRVDSKELINKTGTLLLALAANEFKKPFYVAANTLKIDRRKKFIIEERPAKEIRQELIRPGKLEGIKIRNPAFDRVPLRYVKNIITEKGVFKPKEILRMR
ncbi:MAG: S-methyl-5-thioribose-1-phosphate isomerase [Candidatus Aenigmarchaeota archaeon]|nr:S-methyl-5-thioribose-1-phosphate isomerase [Candidatus Aenigmarchaeota archaeon]